MGCHTTLERVLAQRAKEKCIKDSDFNPSVVNSESLVDTAIGVGELDTKKPSAGLNKSTRRAIHLRTRCKETFVNGLTRQRKGKVTASPRAKAKVKARARENIQEKGTTTRTRLDLRMKMDSAHSVILVQNVKELNLSVMSKRMMVLRVPVWIEQHMSFAFKSAIVFQWIRRNCRVRRREFLMGVRSQRAPHEKFDQSTGVVLFAVGCLDDRPIVDSGSVVHMSSGLCDDGSDRKSAIQYELGECVG